MSTSIEKESVNPITDEQVVKLLLSLAKSNDIEFVASPTNMDDVAHSDIAPSVSLPLGDTPIPHTLLPIESALFGGTPEFTPFFLFEAQLALCDAGFNYSMVECPLIFEDDQIRINRESPIPLSLFLLSADRTFQSLSKLMSDDFYQSQAISTAWFARSLATVNGQPTLGHTNNFALSMSE